MEIYEEIDKNEKLTVGKYRITFKTYLFAEQLASLIDSLKGLIANSYEIVESKPIKIYKVETDGDNKILIYFELLKNPVPVAVIVTGIITLLGIAGTLLIFDKIEKISESPLGFGAGVGLSAGSIALLIGGVLFLFKYFK